MWFFSPWLGAGTWRSEWPAMELERRGITVHLVDRHTPAGLRERVEQVLEPSDVIVLHVSNMIRGGLASFVDQLQGRAAYVLLQFDDDYTAHEDVQIVRDTELMGDVIDGIKLSSGVICATPGVQRAYERWAPWAEVIPNRMPGRVGAFAWNGTPKPEAVYMAILSPLDSESVDPHFLDGMMVADEIGDRPLHVLGGSASGTPEVFPHASASGRPLEPDIRWRERPAGNLYRTLARYRVAIAPLRDTRWNRAKSWIKALEAASVGVPAVVSDVEPYRLLADAGVPVWFATEPDEWGKHIDHFLGMELSEWRACQRELKAAAAAQAIEAHSEWFDLVTAL